MQDFYDKFSICVWFYTTVVGCLMIVLQNSHPWLFFDFYKQLSSA